MIRSATVVVLGAGASFEVGFPIGSTLLESIQQGLDFKYRDGGPGGDRTLRDIITQLGVLEQDEDRLAVQHWQGAAQRISEASQLAASIDNILEQHQGNEKVEVCGKLAIVRYIGAAERECEWRPNPNWDNLDFRALSKSWYPLFAKSWLKA